MQRTRAPTPFTPALRRRFFGVDFNPMVDRIRVTSDANQNIRLHPDDANVVGADADLNPGDPTVVGSAYTGSSFSAGLASSTVPLRARRARRRDLRAEPAEQRHARDAAAAGHQRPRRQRFDIAGRNNVGYVATASDRRPGAELHRVNVQTGDSVKRGRIGRGAHTITGLAAVQDLS